MLQVIEMLKDLPKWDLVDCGVHGPKLLPDKEGDLIKVADLEVVIRQVEVNQLIIADYEEVLQQHKELVKELDVILNGFNAAEQASLCDIVAQLKNELRTIERLNSKC